MKVSVLRLGHRVKRDDRVTTHVFLVARAFGCERGILSGDRDEAILDNIRDVVDRWGGIFEVRYEGNWRRVIRDWGGLRVLLTMYGLPIQERIGEIRGSKRDLLIIVGSEKVPGEVYRMVDWNIAVTSQPHSEVAALAVFLHMLFEGKELEGEFKDAKIKVIPQEKDKKVLIISEDQPGRENHS
ncbi:MAG: tRNA (cytidine(56)-2'-O)-methyltransferase [Candidatus Geothermarchaeales archaeon]